MSEYYSLRKSLSFFMSRNVIDSRTPTKSVVESKSILGLLSKVLVVGELQQWLL